MISIGDDSTSTFICGNPTIPTPAFLTRPRTSATFQISLLFTQVFLFSALCVNHTHASFFLTHRFTSELSSSHCIFSYLCRSHVLPLLCLKQSHNEVFGLCRLYWLLLKAQLSPSILLHVFISGKSPPPIHIEPMSAQVKGRIQDQQLCGKPTEIGPDHFKNW